MVSGGMDAPASRVFRFPFSAMHVMDALAVRGTLQILKYNTIQTTVCSCSIYNSLSMYIYIGFSI